jgi:predicted transcriptional regulator
MGAAKVGRNTEFTVDIRNLGVQVQSVPVEFTVYDSFGGVEHTASTTVEDMTTGQDRQVAFTWKPLRSGTFSAEARVTLQDDANPDNDAAALNDLVACAWTADFEGGQLTGWELRDDRLWHITGKVLDDPEPGNHSSPNALYHGAGGTGTYGVNERATAISPSIDLRRFDTSPSGYARMLLRYTGASAPGDILYIDALPDGDETGAITLQQISGDLSGGAWTSVDKGGVTGIGLPGSLLGGTFSLRLRWESDGVPNTDLSGFYIDDILVYGPESEPFGKDVGVEELDLTTTSAIARAGAVDEPVPVRATVTNYGTETLTGVQAHLTVTDYAGEVYLDAADTRMYLERLEPGESWVIDDWSFTPEQTGYYNLGVTAEVNNDEDTGNNHREQYLDVAKYLADFEGDSGYGHTASGDPSGGPGDGATSWGGWSATGDWHLEYLEAAWFDPLIVGHSPSYAWYVGGGDDEAARGKTSTLTSPLIDLQGVNTGSAAELPITASFRFFGDTGDADELHFEYRLDETGDWEPLKGGTIGDGVISGAYDDEWLDTGSPSTMALSGHLVRFRMKYVAADDGAKGVTGLYIDDFKVSGWEEDRHRPSVRSVSVSPEIVRNDGLQTATVTATVHDADGDVASVTVDLSPVGGPPGAVLEKVAGGGSGSGFDGDAHTSTYSAEFVVEPNVGEGVKQVRVTAADNGGRKGYNLAVVDVTENRAPTRTRWEPLETSITVNETEQVHFYALGADMDGGLTYTWYVDGREMASGPNNKSFTLETGTEGNWSAGEHVVRVVVEDDGRPPLNFSIEWTVDVIEVLADVAFDSEGIRLSRTSAVEGTNVTVSLRVRNAGLDRALNVTVSLQQLGQQAELTETFATVNVGDMNPGATRVISVNWTAVMNITVIKATLDPDGTIGESDEDNNVASVSLEVVEKESDLPDDINDDPVIPPVDVDPVVTDPGDGTAAPVWTNAVAAGLAVALFGLALLGMTEVGTYGLFSMFLPLYSRIKGMKVLRHNVRDRIYNYIRANPGVHYRHIMSQLQMKNGTLVHHLMRLEQEELIRSEMDGLYKRFYPMGMKIPQSESFMVYPSGTKTYNVGRHQLSEVQLRIVRYLWNNPGISQKDISDGVSESRRVVNYHMKLLETNGLVVMTREGRKMACYVPEGLFPEEDLMQYFTGRTAPEIAPAPTPRPVPAVPKPVVPGPAAPGGPGGGGSNGMKAGNGLENKDGPGSNGFRDEKTEIDVPSGLPAAPKGAKVPRPMPVPKPKEAGGGIKTGEAGGGIRTGAAGGIKTREVGGGARTGAAGGGIRTGSAGDGLRTTGGGIRTGAGKHRPLVKKKKKE